MQSKSVSRVCSASKLLHRVSIRHRYSSSFDPYWTLHVQNVTREQQEAFKDVWANDTGNFKQELTPDETKLFERKVKEIGAIDGGYNTCTCFYYFKIKIQ